MPARSRLQKVLDLCQAPDKLPLHRGVSVSTPGSWPTPRPCHVRGIRNPWLQAALTVQLLSVCGHTRLAPTAKRRTRDLVLLSLSGGLAYFSLSACLSSSTSTSPLPICVPRPGSCPTSGKKLDDCSSLGNHLHTLLLSQLNKTTFVSQQFLNLPCRFHSRMNLPSPFSHSLTSVRHLSGSNNRFLSRFSRQTFLRFSEYLHPR